MRCVVCHAPVDEGDALYKNSWEAARKRFACCSQACREAFDPDLHWIPSRIPDEPSETETAKLLRVVRDRLRSGDAPAVVVREMLVAGIPLPGLRKVVNEAMAIGLRAKEDASQFSLLGGLFGWIAINRDKRRPSSFEAAFADIDQWEEHARARW
jgi:hypothetical protein